MSDLAPYYVLIDTNVLVRERLLQSSIGNAFLYAVTAKKSFILLPEVVELEIARVLPEMAEKTVSSIKSALSLL
jgi:predicted nucleic acid-binding protein